MNQSTDCSAVEAKTIFLPLFGAFSLLSFFGVLFFLPKRKEDPQAEQSDEQDEEFISISSFEGKLMHDEVIRATNSFDAINCIEMGGCGNVYKANLLSLGIIVAVKKLNSLGDVKRPYQKEFLNEIRALTQIRHRNIKWEFEEIEAELKRGNCEVRFWPSKIQSEHQTIGVQSWEPKDLKGMLEIFERREKKLEELLYQKWKELDNLLEYQIERRKKLFQEAQSKSQFQDLELRSQISGGFTENGKKTENVAAFTNEDALELCLAQGGKTLQDLEWDFLPHMSSISEFFEGDNDEEIEDNNHGTKVYWGDDKELGKTKESVAKKETISLDDKIHGDGDMKKLIQKNEKKFQILEDSI
ncbi:hypothetical protein GH714_025451 [Hevea brasiliensis]|uniref:non-specific serine/threonine protein kinase n=1 Tax=Hevea brasiliensis TaxID=3981 RepID=A0A6A6KSD5_HEVBR|nr:hypothetical protein GH714_025451 [Hevea brasiliensis]